MYLLFLYVAKEPVAVVGVGGVVGFLVRVGFLVGVGGFVGFFVGVGGSVGFLVGEIVGFFVGVGVFTLPLTPKYFLAEVLYAMRF